MLWGFGSEFVEVEFAVFIFCRERTRMERSAAKGDIGLLIILAIKVDIDQIIKRRIARRTRPRVVRKRGSIQIEGFDVVMPNSTHECEGVSDRAEGKSKGHGSGSRLLLLCNRKA